MRSPSVVDCHRGIALAPFVADHSFTCHSTRAVFTEALSWWETVNLIVDSAHFHELRADAIDSERKQDATPKAGL
jgi:hypothetical protein